MRYESSEQPHDKPAKQELPLGRHREYPYRFHEYYHESIRVGDFSNFGRENLQAQEFTEVLDGDLCAVPGFNLQEELQAQDALAIEVAGPTRNGYRSLEGITFPKGLTVTNVEKTLYKYSYGATTNERKRVLLEADEIVDAESLPYEDESLGMILVSALPQFSHRRQRELSLGQHLYAYKSSGGYYSRFTARLPYVPLDQLRDELEAKAHLCINFLFEAERTLQPGGLLLMRHASDDDVLLAQHLGFSPKIVAPARGTSPEDYVEELLFQKG